MNTALKVQLKVVPSLRFVLFHQLPSSLYTIAPPPIARTVIVLHAKLIVDRNYCGEESWWSRAFVVLTALLRYRRNHAGFV